MRVRLAPDEDDAPSVSDGRLTFGAEYEVVGISVARSNVVSLVLVGDDGRLDQFDARMFDLVSATVPTSWRARGDVNDDVRLWLGPPSFLADAPT